MLCLLSRLDERVDRCGTEPPGTPVLVRLMEARARGEEIGHYGILALRVTAIRYLVPFAAAFGTWCVALRIARPAVVPVGLAIGFGLALADVLACLGVLAARSLDAADALRLGEVLTTTQEFPAIPMPDYLIAEFPPLYEPEIALWEPATVAAGWLPVAQPVGLPLAA